MKVQKNRVEWTAFGVSLALILSIVGYLVYEMATVDKTPPQISISLGAANPGPDSNFVVPVSVLNKGGRTAETVKIEVLLKQGDTEELSELEMDFLPARTVRHGWVTFRSDPRAHGHLQSRVVGYKEP